MGLRSCCRPNLHPWKGKSLVLVVADSHPALLGGASSDLLLVFELLCWHLSADHAIRPFKVCNSLAPVYSQTCAFITIISFRIVSSPRRALCKAAVTLLLYPQTQLREGLPRTQPLAAARLAQVNSFHTSQQGSVEYPPC